MKNKLIIIALLSLMALPSSAVITTDEATDFETLKLQGYSTITADGVQNSKARANGESYTNSVKVRYDNSPVLVRWIRNAFIYFDPAYDDGKSMQHDIKYGPTVNDL